jgi:hypothetical protein
VGIRAIGETRPRDTDHAIIVDVEATAAVRQAEVLAAKRMIERTMESLTLYLARGDSGMVQPRCSADVAD